MSQTKKYSPDKKDPNLKREDQRKSDSSATTVIHGLDFIGRGREANKGSVASVKVKKKLPLAVDIIVGILMLAILCGVIVGSYMLFRYFSDDHEVKNVSYSVIFMANKELSEYGLKKGGELYMDVNGDTVYLGKIETVNKEEKNGVRLITLKVNATANYRKDEGYSIGDTRLAVGSEFDLRYLSETLRVSVVELAETGGK